MGETPNLKSLSDDDLLRGLSDALRQFRRDEVDLIAHIGEVDERRLYAREASPSMFAWCMEVLHLSEAETALRIGAARAARRHPMLLTMLGDGRLHLSGLGKLAPHLTRENRDALLKRATHRSKRQIEEIVAELKPRPDASPVMRKLPARREQPAPDSGQRPDAVVPAIPDRLASPSPEQRPDAVAASPALTPARPAVVEPLAPRLMAEHDYGEEVMARYRRSGRRVSELAAVYGAVSPVFPGEPPWGN